MKKELQNLTPEMEEKLLQAIEKMEHGQSKAETSNESPKEKTQMEQVREMLEGTQKGSIKNSINNCVLVFQNDPLLKGAIKFNMLTEQIDIVRPLGWERGGTMLNDTDMKYILLHFEKYYGLYSEKKIETALRIVANENRYHPIQVYLKELPWDGNERIRHALTHFLGAEESEYTYQVFKLFLMGAINRVFRPGCKFDSMMCLVGGQGAGKSTFFRMMAIKDEWFSDDLRKLEDENVYRKLQGHWIMEMSEMLATANAKSIEEIKSFLSRQKETYKVPYETHPADRLRQCVFAGTTNRLDFLPRDRSGNRRFHPIQVHPEKAEVHILEDEQQSRLYIDQIWAEAMEIYRQGNFTMALGKEMEKKLCEYQKEYMQEDVKAGILQAFLEDFKGDRVCSKLLYAEAFEHGNEPADWETREICDIMNSGIASGLIKGWIQYKNPKRYPKYGSQKGWERVTPPTPTNDGFCEISDEEARQLEMIFGEASG